MTRYLKRDLNGNWYDYWSASRWARIKLYWSPEARFRRRVENDMEWRMRWH